MPTDPLIDLRLHHTAVVVRDLEVAAESYARLGLTDGERLEIPEQGIIAITYRTGVGYLELIQPTDPEGAIGRYMAKRGEGIHHVAYAVDDIAAALEELKGRGVRLIDETPRIGAHGWRIGFIHPESCHGVLTELVEE